MWTTITSRQDRDKLVQDHRALRDHLRQRFEAEKLGEEILQTEAAKLFKPITSEVRKQGASQTEELARITEALESAPIEAVETPAHAAKQLAADPDAGLDISLIRQHKFLPPSELDLSDQLSVTDLIKQINNYNRYTLGVGKRSAVEEERATLTAAIKALGTYRDRVRLLSAVHKPHEKHTGSGLKLRGNQFGNLIIDPGSLAAGQVRAFRDGNLVLEAPAEEALYSLLTKRFVKAKRYTPQAIETFKQLVELAGLPVHGRKSKKHQLIRGGVVQYYNDPNALVERLQLLEASKRAGNTGLDNEISAIIDELMRSGAIPMSMAVQLNKALLL